MNNRLSGRGRPVSPVGRHGLSQVRAPVRVWSELERFVPGILGRFARSARIPASHSPSEDVMIFRTLARCALLAAIASVAPTAAHSQDALDARAVAHLRDQYAADLD